MFKMSKTFSLVGFIFCGFIFLVSFTCWIYLIMKEIEPGNIPFLTLLSGFTTGMYGFMYRTRKKIIKKTR